MLPESDHISRRGLLATGLAAAGTLALGGRWATAAPQQGQSPSQGTVKNEYAPFKVGIQSYSLRHYDFNEAMQKIKQLGLHHCESYSKHTPPDASKALGFKVYAADMGVHFGGFGVSGFSKNHDANRKYFEFGKQLGVSYLSADPDRDAFDSLDKLVAEYDIAIGIHPHGPGAKWVKIDQIHDAIKGHHEKIGVCLDTGHFLRAGEDPLRAAEVFANRIYGVHLKDVKGGKTFTVLGKGDLKLGDFMQALAKQKYGHVVALEYEENEANPIPDIEECLNTIKSSLDSVKN